MSLVYTEGPHPATTEEAGSPGPADGLQDRVLRTEDVIGCPRATVTGEEAQVVVASGSRDECVVGGPAPEARVAELGNEPGVLLTREGHNCHREPGNRCGGVLGRDPVGRGKPGENAVALEQHMSREVTDAAEYGAACDVMVVVPRDEGRHEHTRVAREP